jgi:hypothetical protein
MDLFETVFCVCFYICPLIVGYATILVVAGPRAVLCYRRLMSWFHTKYIAAPPPTDEERFREIATGVNKMRSLIGAVALSKMNSSEHLEFVQYEGLVPLMYFNFEIYNGDRSFDFILAANWDESPYRLRHRTFVVGFGTDGKPVIPEYMIEPLTNKEEEKKVTSSELLPKLTI